MPSSRIPSNNGQDHHGTFLLIPDFVPRQPEQGYHSVVKKFEMQAETLGRVQMTSFRLQGIAKRDIQLVVVVCRWMMSACVCHPHHPKKLSIVCRTTIYQLTFRLAIKTRTSPMSAI